MDVATVWCPWVHANSKCQRSREFSSILGEDQDLSPGSGHSTGYLETQKAPGCGVQGLKSSFHPKGSQCSLQMALPLHPLQKCSQLWGAIQCLFVTIPI